MPAQRTFGSCPTVALCEQAEALSGWSPAEQSAYFERCLATGLEHIPRPFALYALLPRLAQILPVDGKRHASTNLPSS